MPPPAVSVAICMHNGLPFIEETLDSVFAQTFQDFEIVIVDDGSTDGSAGMIERRYSDPRLRLLRQSRQTLRGARPAVLAHARGTYVAFLDHDDVWLPDKLARQVELAGAGGAALVFSDCFIIDESGATIGRLSQQYDFSTIDLADGRAYLELLRRGCFISYSTALARTDALRAAGGFSRAYQYVSDYDLWLKLARRFPMACIAEPLARYRVHRSQFTQSRMDITLPEHIALLRPIMRSASHPDDVRRAIRDNLFGQHRVAVRLLGRQGRWLAAARAAAGMARYPVGVRDYLGHRVGRSAAGPALKALRGAARRPARIARLASLRARRAPARAMRLLRSRPRSPFAAESDRRQLWFDGSSLGEAQTGYFALLSELIRRTALSGAAAVHVTTSARGEAALRARLGADAVTIRFHRASRRDRRRSPRGRAPHPDTTEVIVWQGRFRWRTSRRIAIVQDLTTRIHPELHTPENIAEFEAFLAYVERHAREVATVSEHSRRDIVERLTVCPSRVRVLPMPVHPQYVNPVFDAHVPARHGLDRPYILCVGTLEPRKNLRRLVRAFERLQRESVAAAHALALAGPPGWDPGFAAFAAASSAAHDIRVLGFVPLEDLPSLYHFATAVVYPSLYEGFGLPVLEAMCASGIVLTSNVSSLPEVIGEAGLQFDPRDETAIANALRQAITLTPDAAAEYRARCRRRAEALLRRPDALLPPA